MFLKVDPRFRSLVRAWREVADEVARLSQSRMPISRDAKPHSTVSAEVAAYISGGGAYGWMAGWGPNDLPERWTQFGLMHEGYCPDQARVAAPRTTELLDDIDGIHVAAFLRMEADTLLPSHRHPEMGPKTMLQFHLGIEVTQDGGGAWLCVEGAFRRHAPGGAFAFDGSREHFALNACKAARTILYAEYHVDRRATGRTG